VQSPLCLSLSLSLCADRRVSVEESGQPCAHVR
jgi:hypothetical protein